MMMSIALRFIPTLIEETDKIMSAQKARGADFETGNLFHRAKALVPILVPLFISAFRRADELAMAMECRCYRGGDGAHEAEAAPLSAARYPDVCARRCRAGAASSSCGAMDCNGWRGSMRNLALFLKYDGTAYHGWQVQKNAVHRRADAGGGRGAMSSAIRCI